ncbi:MAG: arginine--tRNA ligase [Bacilli bacterium]|nr:arginine--tRNA ligase [Acholeplasmataceae bacterium]MDY2902298.1 arginine--tRNA ligase [Bacilli bacterium]
MIELFLKHLKEDLQAIIKEMGVSEEVEISFDIPKDTAFGDYSTNIAMRLAKTLHKAPALIANEIVSKLDKESNHLSKVEVAGAGFINFYIDNNFLSQIVFQINNEKENYGNNNYGGGKKVNIEFVSANPTGFLHIGHCRGAAYGDSLARIMKKAGYIVSKEHYVNDAGNQIKNLAHSIFERYKELFGLDCDLGDDDYHGKEIITIANMIKDESGDSHLHDKDLSYFRDYGVNYLLNGLKHDLHDFNVDFDTWFSEKSLYDTNAVQKTLQFLIDKGYTYEEDGAIWLKTMEYGDEKNRVLVKSDKTLTYFTPDIAYHANKLSRGYDFLIDVLGADHHGYISRLKAAIAYVGGNPDLIDVEILQMVRVIQDGMEVKMSKRSGKAITMRDLIDEVGTDALRYLFVSKALSTHMDLDLDLAVKQSNENPVYYAQYAYARICSLFRNVKTEYHEVTEFKTIDLSKAKKIIMNLIQYPSVVKEAAEKKIPHRICQYVYSLAQSLHGYYNEEHILTEDPVEMNEKLTLLNAVRIVLKDSLNLIGVGVKEEM